MQYMKQYIAHRYANGVELQQDMAKELGWTKQYFSQLKGNKRELTHKAAEKMATITGLSPSYWLNLCNKEKYKGWKK